MRGVPERAAGRCCKSLDRRVGYAERMRVRNQRLTRFRVSYEGAVLRVYEMESGGRWFGYWTSQDVGVGGTLWRAVGWLLFRRPPRTYHPVVADTLASFSLPPSSSPPRHRPPRPRQGGGGVREPRRPIRPTSSGAAAPPPADDE